MPGFPWLQKHNPKIDWKTEKIKWKKYFLTFQQLFGKRKTNSKPMMEEQPDKEEWKNQTRNPINEDMNAIFMELLDEEMEINKINIATELAIEDNKKKTEKTDEELIPKIYHEYLDIFSEEKAAQFPESKPWDHKIKMKEGLEPKLFKNYNLTPVEQLKLDNFLKEILEKGYLQPSKSPMASPFSFVSKKDRKI